MNQKIIIGVLNNPEFQKITKKRNRWGWCLSVMMFFIYISYVLYMTFSPESFF